MSNYKKITRHPLDGHYENATWLDDYFGPHLYGVAFSDKKVYPAEQVNNAQLKEFWAADVIETLRYRLFKDSDILSFLADLQYIYNARWKRDPLYGEGAVDNLREKKSK